MPQIQLLDGKKISFTKSINGFDIVKKISKSLEKKALIMEVDGKLTDLSFDIKNSIPSIVPIGLIILLRTFIFERSSFSKRSSSLLVPDLVCLLYTSPSPRDS